MEQNNSTTNGSTALPSSVISPNDLLIDVTKWSRSDSVHPTHKDTYTFYADYDWLQVILTGHLRHFWHGLGRQLYN